MRRFALLLTFALVALEAKDPVDAALAARAARHSDPLVRRDEAPRISSKETRGRAAAAPAALAGVAGYVGGSGTDSVNAMVRDRDGNLILAGTTSSPDFKATEGAVSHDGGNVFVQKVKADGSAVLWRAILGGAKTESADAVAVDSAGAVYVAGSTDSLDFPTTEGAFQRTPQGLSDGFVAKLSADGKKLEYCTYLGGAKNDWLNAIAVDAQGQAAVTGWTGSTNFPAPSNSMKSAYTSGPGAIVARLDAEGKSLKQGTVYAGNGPVEGYAILAPADGSLMVAGATAASDLPAVKAWQKSHQGSGVWRSDDSGLSWKPGLDGMRGLDVRDMAVDPKNPQIVYAATSRGMYKSTDGGASWKEINAGLASTDLQRLALDPSNPLRLFTASTKGSLYRSTDGGLTWTAPGSGLGQYPYWLGVDPKDSKVVYAVMGTGGVLKSTDGGDNWTSARTGLAGTVMTSMAIHPETPNVIFAAGYGGLYRSDDSAGTWTRVPGPPANDIYYAIAFDPRNLQTIYLASYYDIMYKSTDGGASWRLARNGISLSSTVWEVQPSPKQSDLVYAATSDGLYRSVNGGQSWTEAGYDTSGLTMYTVRPDPVNAGVVHAGGILLPDGFFLHVEKDGTSIRQSSYVGGARDDKVRRLAVDAAGDVYLAGGTESEDFPATAGGLQSRNAGDYDAFLVRLDKQGTAVSSTLLGGRLYESVYGLSVADDGTAWLAGMTLSGDFPVTGGVLASGGGLGDLYVAQVSTAAPRYVLSTALGGSGIETVSALVAGAGGVWVAGATSSRDLPTGLGGLGDLYGGGLLDGFLMHVSGLAAGIRLDASVALEILQGGEVTTVAKRLPVTSSAGTLPMQVKTAAGAPWLTVKVEGNELVVAADAAGLEPGEYRGSFEVSAPAAGVAAIPVAVTLTVKASTPPVVLSVLHAARMTSGPVSPGLVIRVLGEGFPSSGARLLVNGVAAPIERSSAGEISAIVPYAVAGAAEASFVVQRGSLASAPFPVPVAPTAPGLFTRDGSGEGPALANNEDGTANTSENAAVRGRPVVLWATGEGVTDPAGIDGAPALDVLPRPVAEVEVWIGGVRCDVYYAGAQPARPAGYMELNLKVPDEIEAGAAVPVVLRIGGVESERVVTIAVK